MRAWGREFLKDEDQCLRNTPVTRRRCDSQVPQLVPASVARKSRCIVASRGYACKIKGELKKRSRSRDSRTSHQLCKTRSTNFSECVDPGSDDAGRNRGRLRAWRDEYDCSTLEKATIAFTCEYDSGVVKCTNMAGVEIGAFEVPSGAHPYGSWLGAEVSKLRNTLKGTLCLIKRDGSILWREDERSTFSTTSQKDVAFRERRFTGRERFSEGHDDRFGGSFAEYYTPRLRPYTHRERWSEGHDDRDGWTYGDHAASVRPFSDPAGFAR